MKFSKISSLLLLMLSSGLFAQMEVTVTIGYPDNPNHFLYSIPPSDEHARFGGEYYFKVENTGSVDLNNFELTTIWKALNSTWGVVEKTTINASTGEIMLTGPSWDPNLSVGESFVLNGEWVPSASIEDWIEFLPREITMTANGGGNVAVNYDTNGIVATSSYDVQKVLPFSEDRKTHTSLKVVAYYPIFDAENAWCSLQKYGANIDQLRVQLYSIDSDGNLRAGQDLPAGVDPIGDLDYWYDYIDSIGVVQYCQSNAIELIPVVYNYNNTINDFDQLAVNSMMTDPTKRATHLVQLEQLLVSHSEFDGIDIDYESLMASDRDNYSSFMEDLAGIVHSHGKLLTTAVHTKVGPGTWYGPQAQDFQRIGNAVDEMLIMTYDLHWATSPTYNDPPPTAGCQATPDWMNDVLQFAITEIDDPSKVQLGVPFYGYRWKHLFENHTLSDPGVGLTHADAMQLLSDYGISPATLPREPNGNEPYFIVDIGGVDWIGYYQDGQAITYKLSALDEYDIRDYIGGVGIWRIGNESDDMWESLVQSVKGSSASIDASFLCSGITTKIEPLFDVEDDVDFYPNPVSEILKIVVENKSRFKLFDVSGKKVYSESIGEGVNELDLSDIIPGTYILQITHSGKVFHRKLFVN